MNYFYRGVLRKILHRIFKLFIRMDNNRKKLNLSTGFCIASTLFVLVLFGIMLLSHRRYISTQEAIKYSHTTHIKSVESYILNFNNLIEDEYGKIVVNTTKILDSLNNVPKRKQGVIEKDFYAGIISSIKANSLTDASTFNHQFNLAQKELLLNQQNLERLLELHYAELDNQQMTLTIWAAVLSIIFLTFGFFAIFKIEESKKEAQDHLKITETKCNEIIGQIESNNTDLQAKLTRLDNSSTSYDKKVEEINTLLNALKTSEENIKQRTEDIVQGYDNIDSKLQDALNKIDKEYRLRFEQKEQSLNKIIEKLMKRFNDISADSLSDKACNINKEEI